MKQIPLTLSVVIPAYNEELYLRNCLKAIATQTVMPDEVIVVDNNSSDFTARVVESFSFARVVSERRQGLFYARNTGMNQAKSEIIARIDADTIIEPDWVSTVKHVFEYSKVHAVSGPVGYYDMPCVALSRYTEDVLLRIAKAANYDFLMGANMAIRRTVWNKVKDELCNKSFLFEDIDIAIHLSKYGLYPSYNHKMKANVSARRLADKPKAFMRYIGGHTRTWQYHGKRAPIGAYYASGVFGLVYIGLKPLHMMFDPDLHRPSLSYLLQPAEARNDPMATSDIVLSAK